MRWSVIFGDMLGPLAAEMDRQDAQWVHAQRLMGARALGAMLQAIGRGLEACKGPRK